MKLTALGRQQSQNIAGSKQSMQRCIVNNFRHKRQNTRYFWTVSIWDLYFNIGSYRFGKTTVKDNNNNKSQFSLLSEICFGKKKRRRKKPYLYWNTPLLDQSRNGRAGLRQHREVRKSSMFWSTPTCQSAERERCTVTDKTLLVHHNLSFQGISTTMPIFYWFSTTRISRSWKRASKNQGLSSTLKDCANFVLSCHGIYTLHSYFI